jgi:hypothetical protein
LAHGLQARGRRGRGQVMRVVVVGGFIVTSALLMLAIIAVAAA